MERLTFSQIQEELLSECPAGYHLKNYLHDHNMTLKQFLKKFVHVLNIEHDTYTNSTTPYMACSRGKSRSIGDIFLISRHYYPDCTYKEVYELLLKQDRTDILKCPDIKKYTVKKGYGYRSEHTSEYGYYLNEEIPD